MKLSELNPNPNNPRKISSIKKTMLEKSLEKFGDLSGIVYNRQTERLVGGHQRKSVLPADAEIVIEYRYETPTRTGTVCEGHVLINGEKFKYREVLWDDVREKMANIAANKHGGEFDIPLLSNWIVDLKDADVDLSLTGFDNDEIALLLQNTGSNSSGEGDGIDRSGNMSAKFLVPPFSILDSRQGYWKLRKKQWMARGIKSECGRENLKTTVASPEINVGNASGGSIFDPVLCELAYRWFSPEGGTVLDPFAGGSVRGVVASGTGRQYIGVELREEQVQANRDQGDIICSDPHPVWVAGDSRGIDTLAASVQADLIFSCPPYADLEVYSNDPRDISNMPYDQFLAIYREIIAKTCAKLKENRFAVWVVGEVRDKKHGGVYKNFVRDTIDAFEDAGLGFYNEAILVTPIGSLPLRAGKSFLASRKVGKTHQNFLVFVKGDPILATEACGAIEIPDLSEFAEEEEHVD